MTLLLFVALLTLSFAQSNCQTVGYSPPQGFVKEAITSGADLQRLAAVAKDPLGNLYATGFTTGSNGRDVYTVKFSRDGALLWSHAWNGSFDGDDEGYGLAIDSSQNVYVCGKLQTDSNRSAFVVRKYLKPSGENNHDYTVDWDYALDPANGLNEARAIVLDSVRNSYVAGRAMNGGNLDAVIVKLTPNGAEDDEWDEIANPPHPIGMRFFSGAGGLTDAFLACALDGTGYVMATGHRIDGTAPNFEQKTLTARIARSDGAVVYAAPWAPSGSGAGPVTAYSVASNGNGAAFVVGSANHGSHYQGELIALKIDSSGQVCWYSAIKPHPPEITLIGAAGHQVAYSPDKNCIYVTGLGFTGDLGALLHLVTLRYEATAPDENCSNPEPHDPSAYLTEPLDQRHGVYSEPRASLALDTVGNVYSACMIKNSGGNHSDFYFAVYNPCITSRLFHLSHNRDGSSKDEAAASLMELGDPFHYWAAGTTQASSTDKYWAVRHCWYIGDVNFDGEVDDTDLAVVLSCFGIEEERHPADANRDGIVDDDDVAIVLTNFGERCRDAWFCHCRKRRADHYRICAPDRMAKGSKSGLHDESKFKRPY